MTGYLLFYYYHFFPTQLQIRLVFLNLKKTSIFFSYLVAETFLFLQYTSAFSSARFASLSSAWLVILYTKDVIISRSCQIIHRSGGARQTLHCLANSKMYRERGKIFYTSE